MPQTKQFTPDEVEALGWICRFHPTHWFHEVGCPHMEWTHEQLLSAVRSSKKAMRDITQPLIVDLQTKLAEARNALVAAKKSQE